MSDFEKRNRRKTQRTSRTTINRLFFAPLRPFASAVFSGGVFLTNKDTADALAKPAKTQSAERSWKAMVFLKFRR